MEKDILGYLAQNILKKSISTEAIDYHLTTINFIWLFVISGGIEYLKIIFHETFETNFYTKGD